VEEIRGGEVREEFEAEVSLALDIHLPESYVPEDGDRLWVYKRVASAGSVEGVDRVIEEVVDRYGSAPRQLENLAVVGKAKALAEELRISKVEAGRGRVKLHFAEQTEADPTELVALVQEDDRNTLSPAGLLEVRLEQGADPAAEALALLQRLA
jgi:transcription-repair coupling factor (superfamily II helicase)